MINAGIFAQKNRIFPFFDQCNINTLPTIDWGLVESIDPISLSISNDKIVLEKLNHQIMNSVVFPYDRPEKISKIFHLIQVLIGFLNNSIKKLKRANKSIIRENKRLKKEAITVKNQSKYVCPICEKVFVSFVALDNHFIRRHRGLQRDGKSKKNEIHSNSQTQKVDIIQQRISTVETKIDDLKSTIMKKDVFGQTVPDMRKWDKMNDLRTISTSPKKEKREKRMKISSPHIHSIPKNASMDMNINMIPKPDINHINRAANLIVSSDSGEVDFDKLILETKTSPKRIIKTHYTEKSSPQTHQAKREIPLEVPKTIVSPKKPLSIQTMKPDSPPKRRNLPGKTIQTGLIEDDSWSSGYQMTNGKNTVSFKPKITNYPESPVHGSNIKKVNSFSSDLPSPVNVKSWKPQSVDPSHQLEIIDESPVIFNNVHELPDFDSNEI